MSRKEPVSGSRFTVPSARPPDPAASFVDSVAALVSRVEDTLVGKTGTIRLALLCLLAEGHLLIEDVPGVGKTSLARALADAIGGTTRRIQFTPDLMPTDITGTVVYRPGTEPEIRPGPVFANIVLCDEVNRASPRTQAALLQVMEERQVTIDRDDLAVPDPFMVIATQNPVEMAGTYPLPEAQLDRFLIRLRIGYPDAGAEVTMLREQPAHVPTGYRPHVRPDLGRLVRAALAVHVGDDLLGYVVDIVSATRTMPELDLGASPRASKALVRAARVHAAMNGRGYVIADDVDQLAAPVLTHRLLLTRRAELAGVRPAALVERAVAAARVPHGTPVG